MMDKEKHPLLLLPPGRNLLIKGSAEKMSIQEIPEWLAEYLGSSAVELTGRPVAAALEPAIPGIVELVERTHETSSVSGFRVSLKDTHGQSHQLLLDSIRKTDKDGGYLTNILLQEVAATPPAVLEEATFCGLIGASEPMQQVFNKVRMYAGSDAAVLVTGETGAGKEMVARAIHQLSPRADGPFVRVNCASIPETLFEAELFGHEKGAFTDARQRRTGSFEAADQGTVFLDEVGEVPLAMQAKLLRVLQEKEVIRIGSSSPVKVDVRIVAATNRNLEKMVAEGSFREDLLYRLSVFNIIVPPLRERREDFNLLCRSLLDRLGKELGKPALHISDRVIEKLAVMPWPGNVRQLKNALERAVVLAEDNEIDLRFFASPERLPTVSSEIMSAADSGVTEGKNGEYHESGLVETLEALERRMIVAALQKTGGTKSRAAELLKIPRTQLLYRMKKLSLTDGDD